MKVDFNDCTFGEYGKFRFIEYKDSKYRAIDIKVKDKRGLPWNYTIAEIELENALRKDYDNFEKDCPLDDMIAYYADDNDGVYYILERIFGEEVSKN